MAQYHPIAVTKDGWEIAGESQLSESPGIQLREVDISQISSSGNEVNSFSTLRNSSSVKSTGYNAESFFDESRQPEEPLLRHSENSSLEKTFNIRKQFWRALGPGFIKLLITMALVCAIFLLIYYNKSKRILNNYQTKWFNAWNTGISIALGMNIASALKEMAQNIRWWVLAQHSRSLTEVDLYLQCDSLSTLIKTAWITRRPNVILACLMILLLNLAAQIGVAALSLTYSIDGTSAAAVLKPNSDIYISDLSAFISQPINQDNIPERISGSYTQESTAHAYGLNTEGYSCCKGSVQIDYWNINDTWHYIFLNTPPPEIGNSEISIYSERSINTTGRCWVDEARVILSNKGMDWKFNNQTNPFGRDRSGTYLANATTYSVEKDTAGTCANYTAYIRAYEVGSFVSNIADGYMYDCCINVSETRVSTNTRPQTWPSIAQIAAVAIGQEGYVDHRVSPYQFSYFRNETYFGQPLNGDERKMAHLISEFAIGVFVGAGYQNPMRQVKGTQPQPGKRLQTDGNKAIIVLYFIPGLHLVCFLLSAWLSYRILLPDPSPLSIAAKLAPLLRQLGSGGTNLSGEEIAEKVGNPQVLYTALPVEGESTKWRAMFEHVPFVRSTERFKNGIYV